MFRLGEWGFLRMLPGAFKECRDGGLRMLGVFQEFSAHGVSATRGFLPREFGAARHNTPNLTVARAAQEINVTACPGYSSPKP